MPRSSRHLLAEMVDARPSRGRWLEAGKAIMTTDTYPKVATAPVELGDGDVTINGIAKGAGMIAPDMATMLSFVVTDAPIAAPVLQALLSRGTSRHFNAVTVDSDTSTSDTLLMFATGAAPSARQRGDAAGPRASGRSARRSTSCYSTGACRWCATAKARASSSRSRVDGRRDRRARPSGSRCRSPIRRWSRRRSPARTPIGAASSWRSARPANRPTATVWRSGSATSAWRQKASATRPIPRRPTSAYMKRDEIAIRVDIGLGRGKATVWTCDLTKEYVAINGDYRR